MGLFRNNQKNSRFIEFKTEQLYEECKKEVPSEKIIQTLIEEGANVNAQKNESTSLHSLIIGNKLTDQLLNLYLTNGYDVEQKDFIGKNSLEWICMNTLVSPSTVGILYKHVEEINKNNLKNEMTKWLLLNTTLTINDFEVLIKAGYLILNEETLMQFSNREDFDCTAAKMLLEYYPRLDLLYKNVEGLTLLESLANKLSQNPELFPELAKKHLVDFDACSSSFSYDEAINAVCASIGFFALANRKSKEKSRGNSSDIKSFQVNAGEQNIFDTQFYLESNKNTISIKFKEEFDYPIVTYYTVEVIKNHKTLYRFVFEKPIDHGRYHHSSKTLLFQVIPYDPPFTF